MTQPMQPFPEYPPPLAPARKGRRGWVAGMIVAVAAIVGGGALFIGADTAERKPAASMSDWADESVPHYNNIYDELDSVTAATVTDNDRVIAAACVGWLDAVEEAQDASPMPDPDDAELYRKFLAHLASAAHSCAQGNNWDAGADAGRRPVRRGRLDGPAVPLTQRRTQARTSLGVTTTPCTFGEFNRSSRQRHGSGRARLTSRGCGGGWC